MPSTHSKFTGIAAIEGRWYDKSNVSVRGLFDLIANINCENPNAYHYEMINSPAATQEAIPRIGKLKRCKYLSINAHGDRSGIRFNGDERFTREQLAQSLAEIEGSYFIGLHLSSCSVGTQDFAEYIFDQGVKIKWIAGYSRNVSWIDSSAFDLLFFNELLRKYPGPPITPPNRLIRCAKRIKKIAGGLANELGFGLYTKRQGGGSKNLLRD